MATNKQVTYSTEELFSQKPQVFSTEELFGQKKQPGIPSMLSPQYWWGAAKKIPGQALQMAKAIPEIPPAIAERVGELEMPSAPRSPLEAIAYPSRIGMKVGKEIVAPMATEIGKSFYETITEPKRMIYEEPLEVGFNAMILVSAALGTAGKIPQVVKGARRARGLATEIKAIDKTGKAIKKIVDTVPDELMPDEILLQSAKASKAEIAATMPTELYAGVDLKQVLDSLGVPQVEKKLKYVLDNFHSPDKVLGRHPSGQVIYDALDYADLAKLNWVDKTFKDFSQAAKGIQEGSVLDTGIFKIRDAQLKMADVFKMTPDEAMKFNITPGELSAIKKAPELVSSWNNYLGKNFDYLLRQWGQSYLGKETEARLWQAANKVRKKPVPTKWYQKLTDAEREVFDMYQHKIKDYIPHIFNRSEIVASLENELATITAKLEKAKPMSKQYLSFKKQQIETTNSLNKIRGGDPILYEVLPSKYRFRFFEKRKGKLGYEVSSTKAFKTYLSGIAKKIFDEPALKRALSEWDKLPSELRPYTRWYLRNFMGWDRSPLDSLYGTIKSLQWIRTLGFNPRSAMVNLTQRINTIADIGPEYSIKGWLYGFTKEGDALFKSTGIPKTIPSVLMEGTVPNNALEGLRVIAGWLFSKVEYGNQKHAFLSGHLKGLSKGVSSEEAIKLGIKTFEKNQFRYGRIGMPKVLRKGGGVAFQFWSYPIKQIELLSTFAKESPAKFLGWLAMAEGGRYSLEEFLGLDLSNALGMGFNYGELLEALQSIDDKDIKKVRYHLAQSDVPLVSGGGGGGIFPYGFGPAVGAMQKIIKVFGDVNSEFDNLASEMEPIEMTRIRQAVKAIKEKEGEKYPISHPYKDERMYLETLPQLISRTAFLKPFEETRQQRKRRGKVLEESMYRNIQRQISELIARGELGKALNLAQKYRIPISSASIQAAIKRQKLTREERERESRAMAPFKEYIRR